MALLIVTGVPGTGKTLYCIQRYIIPELKKGGIVYTNIAGLVHRRISLLFGIDIFDIEANLRIIENPAYFYKDTPKNCMFVVDEAQNIFGNREWQKKENIEVINYLNEHRHYGHRIVMITPHVESLDAGIRRIVEFTYKHKSFSAIGNSKTVRCAVFDQCNLYRPAVQFFQWKHDSRIYDCYSSYFTDGTKEVKVRVNPLKNGTLYALIVLILVSGFFAVKNSDGVLRLFRKPKKVESVSPIPIEQKQKNVIMINGKIINGR